MKMDIHTYGDEVLRRKAEPVADVDDSIRDLVGSMIETMHAESGVGLAAEQVGRTESVCVVDVPPEYDADEQGNRWNPDVKMPLALINPEIVDSSEDQDVAEEGCLSFPGMYAPVKRPVEVTVRFLDMKGQRRELRLRKFVARAVQHELDHLNGVLLVDRMSSVKRIALSGRLKRMKRETRDALGVV